MKVVPAQLLLIFIFQIFSISPVFAEIEKVQLAQVVTNTALDIQTRLEDVLPPNTPVVYTIVPRGLIVSINEDIFFSGESILIKKSATDVLDAIISVLTQINNNCTIESHTEGHNNNEGIYRTNWEIAMARANSITDYLVYCGKIPPSRVFSLGYGDCMPFRDTVSTTKNGFDRRIDFVIFSYEYDRD